jgi:hypothetical protein
VIVGMVLAGIVVIGLIVGGVWYLRRGAGAPGPVPAVNPDTPTPIPTGPDEPRTTPADSSTVSLENFKRIRSDMTRDEVEQILGPGVRVPRTEILRAIRSTGRPGRTDSTVLKWQNGRNVLLLELTQRERLGVRAGWYVTEKEDGTVSHVLLGAVQPP